MNKEKLVILTISFAAILGLIFTFEPVNAAVKYTTPDNAVFDEADSQTGTFDDELTPESLSDNDASEDDFVLEEEAETVNYINENGNSASISATRLTTGGTLTGSAYYVQGETTVEPIVFNSNVKLILKNKSILNIRIESGAHTNGITFNNNLSIYSESTDTVNMGIINIYINDQISNTKHYAIRSDNPVTLGIYGGKIIVLAPSNVSAYGIGVLSANSNSKIIIGQNANVDINVPTNGLQVKNGGNIIFDGGKARIQTSAASSMAVNAGNVLVKGGQIDIIGGRVDVLNTNNLSFSFTSPNDYITAPSYYRSEGYIREFGSSFSSNGNVYVCSDDGTVVTGNNIHTLSGKTIKAGCTIGVSTGITNGTLATAKSTAVLGDSVGLTVTPDTGYQVGSVTYRDSTNTEQVISPDTNGNYTFTPEESMAYTLSATFTQITDNVSYIDENGDTQTATNALPVLTGGTLSAPAYYVEGNVTLNQKVTFSSNTGTILILKNGSNLTINTENTDCIEFSKSLKIYREAGTGTAGTITLKEQGYYSTNNYCIKSSASDAFLGFYQVKASLESPGNNNSGIKFTGSDSEIVIGNHSEFTVDRAYYSGIECAGNTSILNSTVNITSGSAGSTVNITSGSAGSAINSKNITIDGTDTSIRITSGYEGLNAQNGGVTINAGTINITSTYDSIMGGNVTINGGKITATASYRGGISVYDNKNLSFNFTGDSFVQASSYYTGDSSAFGNRFNSNGKIYAIAATGVLVNGSNIKNLTGTKIVPAFTVTIGSTTNGTLTSNKTSGIVGTDSVELTPTPSLGFKVATVSYTDSSGSHQIDANASGKYIFTPDASFAYTVYATFTEITSDITYKNENDTTQTATGVVLLASGGTYSGTKYYVDGTTLLNSPITFTNTETVELFLKRNSSLSYTISEDTDVNGITFNGNLKIYSEVGSGNEGTVSITISASNGTHYGIKGTGAKTLGIYGGKIIVQAPNNVSAYGIGVLRPNSNSKIIIGQNANVDINVPTNGLQVGNGGNIIFDGGKVRIQTSAASSMAVNAGNVLVRAGQIDIIGGSVDVLNSNNLSFSFTSPNDYITAPSYYRSAGNIREFGSSFSSNGNVYVCSDDKTVVTGDNIHTLSGKTIKVGYKINVANGITNGTLTSDKASGLLNETVTLTPTPSFGYKVATVTYTNSTGTYTINPDPSGRYKFTASSSTIYTVSATFTEITENVSYKDESGTTRVANNAVFLSKGGNLSGAAYYVEGNITLTQGINFTNTSPTLLILKKGSHLTVNNAAGNGISSSGNLKIFITSDSSSSDWGSLTINSTGGKGINNTAGTFTLAGGNINITASDDAVNSNGFTMTGGCLTANGGNGFSGIKLSNTATFSIDLPAGSFLKASSYSDGNASSTPFNSANFNPNGKAYVCIESGEAFTAATMKSITNKTVKAGYNVVVDGSIVKGTLTSDKSGGISGETVTLTPTPDTYYEISRVTYTDSNGTHNVNKNAAGKYTFSASSGMNTVSATFTPINYTITYNDVDGATFTGGNNPSTYNVESPAIRIKNPDKDMAIFKGWEGTDINGKSMNLIIPAGSHGNRTFTATWKSINEGTVDNGDDNKNGYSTEKAESFIHNLYRGILDREADESGLNYWTNQLKDKKISLYQLVKGFTDSTEFTGRGLNDADFIRALYKGVLSRDPAQSEVDSWLDQMNNNGYTRDDVIAGFLYSKELINLQSEISESLGNGKTLPIVYFNQGIYDFVIRNYVCILDREGEPAGVEYWGKILLAGEKTPEEVTMGFLHSPEFRAKRISSEDYVKILYRTFLGREADEEGLKYWVNKLKNGSSREGIVPGFSNSEEFKALLKSYGL